MRNVVKTLGTVLLLCTASCTGTGEIGDGSKSDTGNNGGGDNNGGDDNNGGGGEEPGGGENPQPPPPSATCTNDKFGIKQIYCTKPGGDEWFINMDNPEENTDRFDPKDQITRNMDGSWKMRETQVRMNVFTKDGYQQNLITTYDADELHAKGYMQSPTDWKNVEITGYIKVNDDGGGDDNFAWYARGGFHGNNAGDGGSGCEGTCYKGDLYFNGETRIAKEQWHNTGYAYTSTKDAQRGSIVGKWVGFKTVIYNSADNNGVHVEMYADWDDNNTWTKIDETFDNGGFGNEGDHCNGAGDQPVTWGGPVATFRWDTAEDVDFKNLSVREITPPQ
ncbi:MAG: carbohydrate-binding protein [Kofleriaceae bacterium]